ncbi:MAG: (2Fe-2S) ferredoxin domain-containing protein [Gammaproteobacteria bacterium]|nr:(2Fe-2S) ferredoxin domain-containing protein [Gammaproteobacteria bacterium]
MPVAIRLVVCVNRCLGSAQRSCAGSGSIDLIDSIESPIADDKLDIPGFRRECLGRCETGPGMRIAPGGPFCTEIDQSRLGDIISELKSFIASYNAKPS